MTPFEHKAAAYSTLPHSVTRFSGFRATLEAQHAMGCIQKLWIKVLEFRLLLLAALTFQQVLSQLAIGFKAKAAGGLPQPCS